jgi:glycosyl transferase family 25
LPGSLAALIPSHCARTSAGATEGSPLKTYVINLDRATERLAHMRAVFEAIGVTFERIPAVDGAALGEAALDDFRRARMRNADGWLPGEVGCFLSHFEAWRRIASGPDARAAVFEDDVHVADDLGPLLVSDDWIPPDADIVRLEANRAMRLAGGRTIGVAPGRKVHRALSGSSGSAGYVISRAAAMSVVASPAETHASVDNFLFKPKVSEVARKLQRYQVVPAVCVQDELSRQSEAQFTSQIKSRATRGRGYRDRSNPILRLWPLWRHAVPFRP